MSFRKQSGEQNKYDKNSMELSNKEKDNTAMEGEEEEPMLREEKNIHTIQNI